MRILMGVTAFAFLSACAAAPETTPASLAPAGAKTETAAKGDKKVCRRIPVIGSSMDKKVCQTAEQWAGYDKQGKESVQDFERSKDRNSDYGGGTPLN